VESTIKKNNLILDCSSGISGDMFVGMMLGLGADGEKLKSALSSLKTDDFSVEIKDVVKSGINAKKYDVILKEHVHCHRNLPEIKEIIDGGSLNDSVKKLAKKMFTVVAEAEGKVHGLAADKVHFHEVGAADSIADIVAAAFCIDDLSIKNVTVTSLCEGSGTVLCAHGSFPVPAPATAEILCSHKIPFKITDADGEMITPTGAAILAALDADFCTKKFVNAYKTGIGAGTKDFEHPNILRGFLCEENDFSDKISVLETNVDDTTGEQLSFCLGELFEAGVNDAYFTPIFMKKGRPGYMLTVICDKNREEKAARIIFRDTGSIGIRKRTSERIVMQREIININTRYGEFPVKFSSFNGIEKFKPEAEKIEKAANEQHISPNALRFEAEKEAEKQKNK
jgi:uncharacterized protein (TIGR00299 family) protein